MKIKIIIGVMVILTFIAALSIYSAWHKSSPSVTPNFTAAPQMKAALNIPTTAIPVKQIIVLDKKKAVEKLKLPDEIAKDDNKQIIATAVVPATPDTGKTDVLAVFDEKTQKTEIETKQEPLSFFALENTKAIGLRYGYGFGSSNSSTGTNNTEADLYGRWDFLRVGKVHTGIYAEVNSRGEGKAMINLEYRW